jgi:hypothetical protein
VSYGRLQTALEGELIYTFGGCTVISGTKGSYLGSDRTRETESVNLIYSDSTFDISGNFLNLAQYIEMLKAVALEVTNEESVLIAVYEIYHSN